MRKQHGDLIISGVLVVIGLAMAVGGVGYHLLGKGGRIAPGFMPFVAGIALAVFSATVFAEALSSVRRATAVEAPRPAAAEPVRDGAADTEADAPAGDDLGASGRQQRRIAAVFAMTLVALLITPVTGFLVAFGLLIIALLWFVEREKPWIAGLIGCVAVLASWAVFVLLLQVPLPGGMLGLLGGS